MGLKKILFTLFLALSTVGLTSYGTLATAAEDAAGVKKGINDTVAHIEAALKSIADKDFDAVKQHIDASRQTSKEITGDNFGAKLQLGSDALAAARRAAKADDFATAETSLKEALNVYKKMQGM